MRAVIDTRQSFFDENGAVLAAGRLIVFKYGTTTHADIFQDPELTLPLSNPLGLSSASWTSTQVYAAEDITVLVQKYEGLDEFSQSIFSTVKTFDVLSQSSGTGTGNGGLSIVDTIPDLRGVSGMVENQVVAVKGYSDADDCYVRHYIWSELSMAIDNGGTVISSITSPTGRWVLLYEGDTLDIRAFGCLPSATDVNSQLRAACNWAASSDVTIVIPAGTYHFTSSGTYDCYAALDVAEDVKLTRGLVDDPDSNTWYNLTLWNPRSKIRNTLAGKNFKVMINGEGWTEKTLPITLWNLQTQGYTEGTAVFNLYLNNGSTVLPFDSTGNYNKIILAEGSQSVQINVNNVYAKAFAGTGTLNYATDSVITVEELDTSYIENFRSYAVVKTTKIVHLRTQVSLHVGAEITAYVEASGLGGLTPGADAKLSGGYGGKSNFIKGQIGLDVGYSEVKYDFFDNANGLVNTWNKSTNASGILNMGRAVATFPVSKAGTVYNGTVGGITAPTIILDSVTVQGNVTSVNVDAKNTTFNGTLNNMTSSKLQNCTINATTNTRCSNAVWNEVIVTNDIESVGGSFRLRDVICRYALFIPNASRIFANASWIGGAAAGVYFDAPSMATEGEAIAYNVDVQGLIGLANGVVSITGATGPKRWAINGHYNINIYNNEGINTKRSEGGVITKLNYRYNQLNSNSTIAGWVMSLDNAKCFMFNHGLSATPLVIQYANATKVGGLPIPQQQTAFFPANQRNPYPIYYIEPCNAMVGAQMYMRFYVGQGAVVYGNTYPTANGLVHADPGVVNSQDYFVNFKVYP